jgi:hypothetical protein
VTRLDAQRASGPGPRPGRSPRLAKPEILPRHLRIRIHHAGLQIYESEADIVTSLQQVGQFIEIDKQRTQSSFFGVITGHTESLATPRGYGPSCCGPGPRWLAVTPHPTRLDHPSWRLATRLGVSGLATLGR